MPLSPNLPEVIQAAISAFANGFYVSLPGIITDYSPETQLADVAPAVIDSVDIENGGISENTLPILPNVPVMFPGSGEWRVTFPITPGDTCLLVFSSAELGNWIATGRFAPALTDQRNHLSDAVAIVGLRDLTKKLRPTPSDRMSVGTDDGCTIEIYPDEVLVGGVSASGEDNRIVVQSALNAFVTALTHAIGAAVVNDGGHAALTDLKTQLGAWAAGTVASKAL